MKERMKAVKEKRRLSFTCHFFLITSLPYTPLSQDSHFNCFYSSPPSSLFLLLPVCASRWPCDPVSFCAQQTKEPFEVQVLPRGTGRILKVANILFPPPRFLSVCVGPRTDIRCIQAVNHMLAQFTYHTPHHILFSSICCGIIDFPLMTEWLTLDEFGHKKQRQRR